jgi:hypothetical protein
MGAKLSERGFGNLFWIAAARRRGDLNDFFGDDVRDRIITINKSERASVAQKRTPYSASRLDPVPASVPKESD